ncbi:MAG: hypothetical protein PHE25_05685 [Candidatus Gracilibacteria bacterium]|nr:hypothetical protein [Candidatus Gracilibacteria bacterium]
MHFTTTTEIARKGSKAFNIKDYSFVLNNNKNIGLIIGEELGKALIDSGVLQQLREELWELNDKETVETIEKYKSGDISNSISLNDYRKKYGI